jgi:hypothetical protein
MLNDKNSDYINKDYLLSVYFLYYHSKFLTLKKSEKEEIKSLINDFSKQVKKNITSSKRKYAVLNDLENMNIDYQYYDVKNLKYLDEDRLNSSFNSIFLKFNNSIKSTKRRHISKNVIIGDNKYVAYSFSNKGKHVIKMHVLDLYDIVLKDTVLDSYLYNKTLEKEQLDSFLDSKFKMEIGKTYPTITYQITKYKDHIDFDIYQSKITPKKEGQLSFEEDINYQINNLIKQCFEEQKLPLIYTGINDDNETKFIEIMNNISHILNRFDKDEFNSIYQTLSQKIDNYHYSMKEIDGTYSFNIENPTIYPGLIIQRMIHELILENKNNPEENIKMINKYKENMEQLVNDFNSFNHYVDSKELKETKGKLPKVIKRVNC